ncbi:BA14K family protein [Oricola sp.]|uniref:BA14K family protein n=1 Tax=Oricola sp. TaxID=1979950 RepID=UPI00320BFA68|nr:BA14K family protein [Oricola sp.]
MKSISFKSTVAAVATVATLLSTGIVPVTTASADPIFKPGLTGKIQPKLPGPCANPVLCGPGFKAPPKTPTPPPAPAPSSGFNAGTAAAIGLGIVAGAALVSAANQKTVIVQETGHANAHYSWCFDKYKTYRMEDNSFMSYSGYRKPCISPYY